MNANILVDTTDLSREDWLEYRKQGIGGSDVAAILGISKWKSEIEIWITKTSTEPVEQETNEAIEWGNILEPVIRKHFADVTGKPVVEVKAMLQHPEHTFMLADVDGLTVDDDGNPAILEIKTASEFKRSEWESEIPAYYMTQVQHYLHVTGVSRAYVAVLIGGNTFRIYEVDADAEIQDMLVEVERNFWSKVINNICPEMDGSDAAKAYLDKKYAGGIKERIELPEEAYQYFTDYLEASAMEDSAKVRKQEAGNRIKELMGDHNTAKCKEYTVSWKPVTSERLDTKALKEELPEVYEKYAKSSTSRRFTMK